MSTNDAVGGRRIVPSKLDEEVRALRIRVYDAYSGVFHFAVIPLELIRRLATNDAYRRVEERYEWATANGIAFEGVALHSCTKRDDSWEKVRGLVRPDLYSLPEGASEQGWVLLPFTPRRGRPRRELPSL